MTRLKIKEGVLVLHKDIVVSTKKNAMIQIAWEKDDIKHVQKFPAVVFFLSL